MSLRIRHISTREVLIGLSGLLKHPEKILLNWSYDSDLTVVNNPKFSFVIINNPRLARELLVNHEDKMNKGAFFEIARESIGNGTLLADEPRHETHLDVIKRAFTATRVNEYTETFLELAREEADLTTNIEVLDVKSQVQAFSLKAALRTLFQSRELTDITEFQRDFNREAESLTAKRLLLGALTRTPLPTQPRRVTRRGRIENLLLDAALRVASNMIHDSRTRASELRAFAESLLLDAPVPQTNTQNDVLALLAVAKKENPAHWDTDASVDEILTLLLAGHETTASTLTWALLETAKSGLSPLPTEMIDQIILETLRLHPPAWVLPRVAKVDILLDGTTIPAHTNLLVSPYTLHRNPETFPEPNLFDPGRWNNVRFNEAPDAYMPFGAGPRGCIGQRFAFQEMRRYLECFATTGQWQINGPFPDEEFHLTLRAKGRPSLVRK